MISIPASEWAAVLQRLVAVEGAQARLATMEAQQERMLSMVENFALNTQNAFQVRPEQCLQDEGNSRTGGGAAGGRGV